MRKYVPKQNLACYSFIQEKLGLYLALIRYMLTIWRSEEGEVGEEHAEKL